MTLEEVRDMVVGLLELASAKQELEARISALEGREMAGDVGKLEARIRLLEVKVEDLWGEEEVEEKVSEMIEEKVSEMIESALDNLEADAEITISH